MRLNRFAHSANTNLSVALQPPTRHRLNHPLLSLPPAIWMESGPRITPSVWRCSRFSGTPWKETSQPLPLRVPPPVSPRCVQSDGKPLDCVTNCTYCCVLSVQTTCCCFRWSTARQPTGSWCFCPASWRSRSTVNWVDWRNCWAEESLTPFPIQVALFFIILELWLVFNSVAFKNHFVQHNGATSKFIFKTIACSIKKLGDKLSYSNPRLQFWRSLLGHVSTGSTCLASVRFQITVNYTVISDLLEAELRPAGRHVTSTDSRRVLCQMHKGGTEMGPLKVWREPVETGLLDERGNVKITRTSPCARPQDDLDKWEFSDNPFLVSGKPSV